VRSPSPGCDQVDHTGSFFALSVLGLAAGAIKSTATLCVLEPNLKPICCQWNGKVRRPLTAHRDGPACSITSFPRQNS
jgi:hypothetical protein